jgi:putative tryptophan/tyrosine transport system substrate-binding protein
MRRRAFLAAFAATTLGPAITSAQQPSNKIPRIGILSPAENEATLVFEAFRQGLRELGYVEDRNIILEYRFAQGDSAALPRLAEELANLPVDVIVADTTANTRAAAGAAPTIPIVMGAGIADPAALGLAHSLARPGGNGFTVMSPELSAKRVDLIRTAFPDATAVTVLVNPSNLGNAEANLRATEETASVLGLALTRVEAATKEALRALGPEALGRGGGPLLVLPDGMFWNHRREIVALAAAAHLPAIHPSGNTRMTAV